MSLLINIHGRLFDLAIPKIMGILNVTPDSFFQESRIQNQKKLLEIAEKMLIDGADILDIGGYSTRPQAEDIPIQEEIKRIEQAIKLIIKAFPQAVISIDTFRAEVAKVAVDNGAAIINDISGGQLDKTMFKTVAELQVPYILMHSRGTPQNMQTLTNYDHILTELISFFQKQHYQLINLGVKDVILDLGFGFAKTLEQNYFLLNNLEAFKVLDLPLLVGVSRKSMIYKKLNSSPQEALNGTTVLNTLAISKGANILRVHDVKEAKEVVRLLCQ